VTILALRYVHFTRGSGLGRRLVGVVRFPFVTDQGEQRGLGSGQVAGPRCAARPTRARLIEKGLLYTPGYGPAAFTVLQFDQYTRRNHNSVVPT
jgi:hypothetical protein